MGHGEAKKILEDLLEWGLISKYQLEEADIFRSLEGKFFYALNADRSKDLFDLIVNDGGSKKDYRYYRKD